MLSIIDNYMVSGGNTEDKTLFMTRIQCHYMLRLYAIASVVTASMHGATRYYWFS